MLLAKLGIKFTDVLLGISDAFYIFIGTTINGGESMTQLVSGRTTPLIASHELLELEIKRLRERLQTVESENAAMSVKLSQQQWELEHR